MSAQEKYKYELSWRLFRQSRAVAFKIIKRFDFEEFRVSFKRKVSEVREDKGAVVIDGYGARVDILKKPVDVARFKKLLESLGFTIVDRDMIAYYDVDYEVGVEKVKTKYIVVRYYLDKDGKVVMFDVFPRVTIERVGSKVSFNIVDKLLHFIGAFLKAKLKA